MSLPKKGCRKIVVQGVTYRWRIRCRPTYCQWMGWSDWLLAVEHATETGTTLIVPLPMDAPWNHCYLRPIPVLPSYVARCIQSALDSDWLPTQPGKPFTLDNETTRLVIFTTTS